MHTGAALFRYLFASAINDRLFLALPVALAVSAALGVFLGGSAIAEQREMVAAFLGATIRILIIAGMVLFTCLHIRQAVAGGEAALILSRPISRGIFVLGYGAGMVCAGLLCVLLGVLLTLLFAGPPLAGLLAWGASLALETLLMVLTAVFFGLILNSAISSVLACAGFYVLARISGLLGALAGKAGDAEGLDFILGSGFNLVSLIIPRLDLFTRSEWLVYGWDGAESGFSRVLFQSIAFAPLILAAAMIDFNRKRL